MTLEGGSVRYKLKIAVISTTILTAPPPGYSGLEMVAWLQATGLAKKGHDVVFVSPKGSTVPEGMHLHETTLGESEGQAYSGYKEFLPDCDVIIDHSWQKFSYLSKIKEEIKAPILGVLHAPADSMYQSAPPVTYPCMVAISKDQASVAEGLWGVSIRVCYNGIDLDFYKPQAIERGSRYLFLARLSKVKGPHIACSVSRRTRVRLDVVGDDRLTDDAEYAQRVYSMAKANPNIAYIGGVDRAKTVEYYSTRKALLHMNQFYREPFGLAPVEAQACGMPVIAFDNGAMRETISDKETGFLVKSEDEVVDILKDELVDTLKPDRCREWASQFSVPIMVDKIEELAKEAIETGGW